MPTTEGDPKSTEMEVTERVFARDAEMERVVAEPSQAVVQRPVTRHIRHYARTKVSSAEGGQNANERQPACVVSGGVGHAVEGHGSRAGRDHGDDDPSQLMRSGQASSGEHSARERKREREDGMLPFDHLERDAQVVEQEHGKDSSSRRPVSGLQ